MLLLSIKFFDAVPFVSVKDVRTNPAVLELEMPWNSRLVAETPLSVMRCGAVVPAVISIAPLPKESVMGVVPVAYERMSVVEVAPASGLCRVVADRTQLPIIFSAIRTLRSTDDRSSSRLFSLIVRTAAVTRRVASVIATPQ